MATILTTDPLVFARDANNDLIVPLRAASGIDAALILVRTIILLWRDEYFLNRSIGTPWIETEDGVVPERDAILGQPFDAGKIARVIRGAILGVLGPTAENPIVRDITEIVAAFDGETRNMSLSMVVRTQFGDAPLTATLATA